MQEEKKKLEMEKTESSNSKVKEIEVLNLQNELSSVRAHLQQKESQLSKELEKTRINIKNLESELQEQRNKNDVSVSLIVSLSFFFVLLIFVVCMGRNYEKRIGKLWKH